MPTSEVHEVGEIIGPTILQKVIATLVGAAVIGMVAFIYRVGPIVVQLESDLERHSKIEAARYKEFLDFKNAGDRFTRQQGEELAEKFSLKMQVQKIGFEKLIEGVVLGIPPDKVTNALQSQKQAIAVLQWRVDQLVMQKNSHQHAAPPKTP